MSINLSYLLFLSWKTSSLCSIPVIYTNGTTCCIMDDTLIDVNNVPYPLKIYFAMRISLTLDVNPSCKFPEEH